MAFIPVTRGIKVVLEFQLNGELVANVFYVTRETPIVTVNLTQVATIMADWWDDFMKVNFSTEIALTNVVATDVSIEDGEQSIISLVPPIAGTVATGSLPNNVAIVTSMLTNRTGRSYRGRKYWAGFPFAGTNDNTISSTQATELLNDMISLQSLLFTGGFTLVIASFVQNGAPRVVAAATPVQGYRVDTRVDTQRRRLPGT